MKGIILLLFLAGVAYCKPRYYRPQAVRENYPQQFHEEQPFDEDPFKYWPEGNAQQRPAGHYSTPTVRDKYPQQGAKEQYFDEDPSKYWPESKTQGALECGDYCYKYCNLIDPDNKMFMDCFYMEKEVCMSGGCYYYAHPMMSDPDCPYKIKSFKGGAYDPYCNDEYRYCIVKA